MAELGKLTEHCWYGEVLNDMLRGRLGCGINHERTQQYLLSDSSSLTLEKALDISLSLESAIIQDSVIENNAAENRRSKIKSILKISEDEKSKCYRCDWKHWAKLCPFIDEECFYCHKKSHPNRVCQKKGKSNSGRVIQTNQVDDQSNTSKGERE